MHNPVLLPKFFSVQLFSKQDQRFISFPEHLILCNSLLSRNNREFNSEISHVQHEEQGTLNLKHQVILSLVLVNNDSFFLFCYDLMFCIL